MLHDLLLIMKMNFFGESRDNLNLSAIVFRDNPSLPSGVFCDNPFGVFRDNPSGVFHDNPSIPSSIFHEIRLLSFMTIFYELF